MNVTVCEHSFSLTSEYDISAPGETYSARKTIFSFTDKLTLTTAGGREVARIEGEISPLRHKHEFFLSDGRHYHFECEKIWKQVFTCQGNGELYHLYQHKGLNYSIFKGDRQIAAFTKNRVVLGKGNEYDVRMDSDADLIVVLCMVLTINTAEHDNDDSTVTIDFGSIGPQERPFDTEWEPR